MNGTADYVEDEVREDWESYQAALRIYSESETEHLPGPVKYARARAAVDAWTKFYDAASRLSAPMPVHLVAERNSLVVEGVLIWCCVLLTGALIPLGLGGSVISWLPAAGFGLFSAVATGIFVPRLFAHYRRRLGR